MDVTAAVAVRVVSQYPCVLAAAALRRVYDQRSCLQRDARQAARQDENVLAVEDVWAQVDMASLECAVDDGRYPRERERRLRNVIAGIGLDPASEFRLLRFGGRRTHQHAITARSVRCLDD